MIRTSQVHHCRACGSTHIVKNGRNRSGKAVPVPRLRGEQGAASQATLQRGAQGRGATGLSGAFLATRTQPTFGITRKTITQWLKKLLSLPTVKETLSVAKAGDVLELDEA